MLDRIKFASRFYFGKKRLFFPVYKLKGSRGLVNASTSLVIEGFPRCGNSSSVVYFQLKNPTATVASHNHVPMQVIRGIELGLPVLLLIRSPLDCAVSFKRLVPDISLSFILRSYIDFYRTLLPYQSSVVVGHFNDVVHHFDRIIEQINRKFKTNFQKTVITPHRRQDYTSLEIQCWLECSKLLEQAQEIYQLYGDRTLEVPDPILEPISVIA